MIYNFFVFVFGEQRSQFKNLDGSGRSRKVGVEEKKEGRKFCGGGERVPGLGDGWLVAAVPPVPGVVPALPLPAVPPPLPAVTPPLPAVSPRPPSWAAWAPP